MNFDGVGTVTQLFGLSMRFSGLNGKGTSSGSGLSMCLNSAKVCKVVDSFDCTKLLLEFWMLIGEGGRGGGRSKFSVGSWGGGGLISKSAPHCASPASLTAFTEYEPVSLA